MENLWLKFKIWTKIGLLSILVIYLLLAAAVVVIGDVVVPSVVSRF